jgi:virulence factor Mce-like protein
MKGRALLEIRRSLRWFVVFLSLCVLGGISAAVIFKNLTFNRPWVDYDTVRVEADDVTGIVPGKHQVRLHGVKVGVVDEAKLTSGRPVLTLRIERKFAPIYRDASMRVRPVTPLQDLYLNITDRGTRQAGIADDSYVIPARRTVDPVEIGRVLDTFDADTRERLTTLLHEIGPSLHDGGKKLRSAFVEVAPFLQVARDATRVLADRERNVRSLVHNFGGVADALAKRDRQLAKLVRRGSASLSELAANDVPLGATISRIPPLLQAMRSSFASLRTLSGDLDPALRSLAPVADELDDGLRGLEQFGADAVPALRALRPSVRELRPMARTLVPTSRALEAAFERLRGQAPQFDRLTQELVPCLDMAQDFFHHTLSVFKFADGLGAFPRAETTIDTDGYGNGQAPAVNTRLRPTCMKKDG